MTDNLLTATPGEDVTVEGTMPGTEDRHTATADDDGIVRDETGRSYSNGAYQIIEDDE